MRTLKLGDSGPDVTALQQGLAALGFNPGAIDGEFGPGTTAAVNAFQRSEGLLPDAVVGPRTAAALGLIEASAIPSLIPAFTVEVVGRMFPATPRPNIERNL